MENLALAVFLLLEEVLSRNSVFNNFEVAYSFENIGSKIMHLNARIYQKPGDAQMILLSIEAVRGKGGLYDEDLVNLS